MKCAPFLLMAAACAASAIAQNTFSGPVTGYIFDGAAHSIRSIMGQAGAASLGPAVGGTWDLASVSPDGRMALAVQGNSVRLIPDLANPAGMVPLDRAIAPVDRIVWSSDSSGAVLYSSVTNQLQRLTSIGPAAPLRGHVVHAAVSGAATVIHTPVDLSFSGATVSGLSVSLRADSVAFASGANGTSSVYLMASDSARPVTLGSWNDPGALAFSADSSLLFVSERATQTIVGVVASSGVIVGTLDASSAKGLNALLAAPGGAVLYGAAQRSLLAWDLTKWQTVSTQTLDITPTALNPIPASTSDFSPKMYLLDYSRDAGSPLWLLDPQSAQVYFVPSGSGAANAN